MERLVRCQVCGLNIARYACKVCGKSVCESCFVPSKGICIICASGSKHRSKI